MIKYIFSTLLLLLLLLGTGATAGSLGGPSSGAVGGGSGGASINTPTDTTGDGNEDYILCGDYDGDSDLDDVDIVSCLEAVTADKRVIELVAGEFELTGTGDDASNTGSPGTTCDNYLRGDDAGQWPNFCLNSNDTIRGQGIDKTLLLRQQTDHYGVGPIIAVDTNGYTEQETASGTRVENVTVEKMTLGTKVNQTVTSGGNSNVGILFYDCDNCLARDVKVKNVGHAAMHLTRTSNSWGIEVHGENVGHYRYGSGTPSQSQPGLYLYSSDGKELVNSGYRNSSIDGVNSSGVNVRVADSIYSPPGTQPFADNGVGFVTGLTQMEQVFEFDTGIDNAPQRVAGIVLYLWRVAEQSVDGNVRVSIQTAVGGSADGTSDPGANCSTTAVDPNQVACSGYGFSDFETLDANLLSVKPKAYYFRRTSTSPTRLLEGSGETYAVVVDYDGTIDETERVMVQQDEGATTDRYTGGNVFHGTGSPGTEQSNQDLDFAVMAGMVVDATVREVTLNDTTGTDGLGSPCLEARGALRLTIDNVGCTDSEGFLLGSSAPVIGAKILDVSATTKDVAASQPAITIQPQCIACTIRGGILDSSPGSVDQDGSAAIVFPKYAAQGGATIDGVQIVGSAGDGIRLGGFQRNVTIKNSRISGIAAGAVGIYLSAFGTAEDGIDGDNRSTRITNNEIDGADRGIHMTTANPVVNLMVSGNTFTNVGTGFYARQGSGTTSLEAFSILNNLFIDYRSIGIDLRGSFSGGTIQGNTFQPWSLGGNLRAGDIRTTADGENLDISGNICHGNIASSPECWSVSVTTDDDRGLRVHHNVGKTLFKADYRSAFDICSGNGGRGVTGETFINSSANELCMCDSSGADVMVSDGSTACF